MWIEEIIKQFFVIFGFDTCWRPTTVKVPNGSRFFFYFSLLWGTDRSQILSPYEVRQTPPTFFRRVPPPGGKQREIFAQQMIYVMASFFVLEQLFSFTFKWLSVCSSFVLEHQQLYHGGLRLFCSLAARSLKSSLIIAIPVCFLFCVFRIVVDSPKYS